MANLDATLLFELRVNFGAQDLRAPVGDGGRGKRALAPAESETFEGPHLRGVVAPPTPDHAIARADGLGWSVHAIL